MKPSKAVKTIYDSGETNPVAFSHGLAILYWALMIVKNPDMSLANDPLPNTAHVVITGNPTDGWTLVNWNGRPVEFRWLSRAFDTAEHTRCVRARMHRETTAQGTAADAYRWKRT
jgi:hypothetical protein